MFLFAWLWCGRRLPGSRRARLQAALIGALPPFGLSLLGYIGVGGMFLLGDFAAKSMLDASVFIYGAIATVILLAGLTSVGLILFAGNGGSETSKPVWGIVLESLCPVPPGRRLAQPCRDTPAGTAHCWALGNKSVNLIWQPFTSRHCNSTPKNMSTWKG